MTRRGRKHVMPVINEWDDQASADRIKRYEKEKKDRKEYLYKSKHGPKRYKEFMKKDAEAKSKGVPKDKRGVRALHKGKWGYMKNRKFTAD